MNPDTSHVQRSDLTVTNLWGIFRTYWNVAVALLLCVVVVVWYTVVVPETLEMPSDFSYETDVVSFDNFYDEELGVYQGEARSNTTFSYRTTQRDDNFLEIQNTFDVRTQTGVPIFSVTRLYGIDAHTGMHKRGVGDQNREGYLWGPRMKGIARQALDRGSFTYWHINYDLPLEMVFQKEEILFGLSTYRYETTFTTDQTKELSNLPQVGVTRGVELDGTLTLWIEPVTGRMISYQDQATAYYYDLQTKERIAPWNSFRNNIANNSVNDQALVASLEKIKVYVISLIVPVVLLVGAVFFLLFFVFIDFFGFGTHSLRKSWRLPVLVALLSIALVLGATYFIGNLIEQSRQSEFEFEADQTAQGINDQLERYTNAIYGSRGFMDASNTVDRDEWYRYTQGLGLAQNYPGIQGFGYAEWIPNTELEAHIESIRASGFPEYTIRPEGVRPEYTSIIFIEPFDERNRQAFGFDMYQEPTRREAMQRARDTGDAALSGKVILVQEIDEDVQAGYLIYVPVFKKDTPLTTIADQQQAISGFVYSAFRMNNFIQRALLTEEKKVNIEIFDGRHEIFTEEKRMYGTPGDFEAAFNTTRVITFGGHAWVVRFSAPANYNLDLIRQIAQPVVLLGGLFMSIVLFLLLLGAGTRRERAMVLAESMTADLRARTQEIESIQQELQIKNNELKQKAETLSEKVTEIEDVNKHMVDRELKMAELKQEIQRLQNNRSQ